MQDERIRALEQRRSAKARERKHAQLRAEQGDSILRTLNEVLGASFTVDELRTGDIPYSSPALAKRIEESQGLVAAYVGLPRARQVLTCCQAALGAEITGELWFDEKCYMGWFSCEHLRLPALADLAMKLEDRVFVLFRSAPGALVVDYYPQAWTKRGTDFSIVAQGQDLELALKGCFLPSSSHVERL